jgi:hypothetical protein
MHIVKKIERAFLWEATDKDCGGKCNELGHFLHTKKSWWSSHAQHRTLRKGAKIEMAMDRMEGPL